MKVELTLYSAEEFDAMAAFAKAMADARRQTNAEVRAEQGRPLWGNGEEDAPVEWAQLGAPTAVPTNLTPPAEAPEPVEAADDKPKRGRRSKVEIAAEKHGVTVEAIHAAAGGECAPGDADAVAAQLATAAEQNEANAEPMAEIAEAEIAASTAAEPEILPPEPAPAADSIEGTYTLEDITAALNAIADKFSAPHALALLQKFGARTRKTLAEEHYGDFVAIAKSAVGTGAWPVDVKVEG